MAVERPVTVLWRHVTSALSARPWLACTCQVQAALCCSTHSPHSRLRTRSSINWIYTSAVFNPFKQRCLTTHLHLQSKLRMTGALTPLPPTPSQHAEGQPHILTLRFIICDLLQSLYTFFLEFMLIYNSLAQLPFFLNSIDRSVFVMVFSVTRI